MSVSLENKLKPDIIAEATIDLLLGYRPVIFRDGWNEQPRLIELTVAHLSVRFHSVAVITSDSEESARFPKSLPTTPVRVRVGPSTFACAFFYISIP